MAPKTTLAMVLTAPEKLEAQSIPIPDISEDSALLRIESCGICGSDYEQFDGSLRILFLALRFELGLSLFSRL